jgi:hypothetical protein
LKLDWPGRASWSGSCFSGEPSSRRRVVVTPRPETGAAEEGGLIPHSEQTLSAESHRPSPLAALPHYQALHELVASAERTLPSGMALRRIVVSAREKTWQGLKEVMYQCVGPPAENYTLVAVPRNWVSAHWVFAHVAGICSSQRKNSSGHSACRILPHRQMIDGLSSERSRICCTSNRSLWA